MHGAGLHREQRDGAAWFTEWLALPQLCIALGRMLSLASETLADLWPNGPAMQDQMLQGNGSIYAETLTFALSRKMPRPAAEVEVKALLKQAAAQGEALLPLACKQYDGLDIGQLQAQAVGTAADDARAFAKDVKALSEH